LIKNKLKFLKNICPEPLGFRGARHRQMEQGVEWSNHWDLVIARHIGAEDDGVVAEVLISWSDMDPFHGQAFFLDTSVCIL